MKEYDLYTGKGGGMGMMMMMMMGGVINPRALCRSFFPKAPLPIELASGRLSKSLLRRYQATHLKSRILSTGHLHNN